jgi:hypothetical protein
MSLRAYLLVSLLGLSLALGVAFFQSTAGYMDASYYMAGGVWLVDGDGFNEHILWNYLDDPTGIPHPSHGYWMPLTSVLAALGMILTGAHTFAAARLGFLVLAAMTPIVTARLSYALMRRRDWALLAGIIAALSGFYLAYLPTTDAFGLYMFFGAIFFLVVQRLSDCLPQPLGEPGQNQLSVNCKHIWTAPLVLGGLAGLMHLTRADGILWLVVAVLFTPSGLFPSLKSRNRIISWGAAVLLVVTGYLLVMGPWLLRNLAAFGSFLSPGGGHALWITSYDELFTYPASLLTLAHWWGSGLSAILRARLWSVGLNLQTMLGVQGQIFLFPLILIGLWRLRRARPVQAGLLAWMLTFLVMTLIFPYQGARGGFFHSGAALQPLFWAVTPLGLHTFLEWGQRRRGWDERQSGWVFKSGIVLIALILTLFVAYNRVIGSDIRQPAWDDLQRRYSKVEQELRSLQASSDSVVVVNDAPTYYLASRRPSISIPYGDTDVLLNVAQRYGGRYLLLEIEQVQGDSLYGHPGDRPGLNYLGTVEGIRLYEFVLP